MKRYWLNLCAGPLLFALFAGFSSGNQQFIMLGILLWMLIWWITSALPIGVTALLPIILFPLCGILDLKTTTANYANPVIYLFFGGFILGLAIEKWNLHRRIALNIMRLTGEAPSRVILGSMIATALLSAFISNTATTVMMLPIGMSVVSLLGDKLKDGKTQRNFALTLMLGIAYAANIGGMSTLIGTPPNLVLAGITREAGMAELGFAQWLGFALPLVIILFVLVFLVNTKLVFPVKIKKLEGIKEVINSELLGLGKMGRAEKRVLIILAATALLWIFRAQLTQLPLLSELSDTIIAIAATVVLFALPSGEGKHSRLLQWDDTKQLPWGILLLFGGGISLAKGMEQTQMVNVIGHWLGAGHYASPLLIVLLITLFAVFLTEVMSNVAMVSVFIPVSLIIAQNLGLNELSLAIPLTLGASCAFMFPISTPPNAIVFSSGYIRMSDMARTGILLNIICIVVIALYGYFVGPYFF